MSLRNYSDILPKRKCLRNLRESVCSGPQLLGLV